MDVKCGIGAWSGIQCYMNVRQNDQVRPEVKNKVPPCLAPAIFVSSPTLFVIGSRFFLSDIFWLLVNFITMNNHNSSNILSKDKEEIYMTNVTESCVFRSCMSFVVGGALGRYSNNRDTISVTGTGKVYSKA